MWLTLATAGRWFPRSERSRAVGMAMGGFHLGSVAGLVLTPSLMMSRFGLQAPFVTFGLAGFAWLSIWLVAISRNPQSQPQISREEYLYIQQGSEDLTVDSQRKSAASNPAGGLPPFAMLLSKFPTWAIIVANAMNNWVRTSPNFFCRVISILMKKLEYVDKHKNRTRDHDSQASLGKQFCTHDSVVFKRNSHICGCHFENIHLEGGFKRVVEKSCAQSYQYWDWSFPAVAVSCGLMSEVLLV